MAVVCVFYEASDSSMEVISRKVGRFAGSAETHHIASRSNASPSLVHITCANSILACCEKRQVSFVRDEGSG